MVRGEQVLVELSPIRRKEGILYKKYSQFYRRLNNLFYICARFVPYSIIIEHMEVKFHKYLAHLR